MTRESHWKAIYGSSAPTELSWYQERPGLSLELIHSTGVTKAAQIIDVGGGASTLVDELLGEGYQYITVLEIAESALERARERLGAHAEAVTWLHADITSVELPSRCYDLWHDRAVFHFLTGPEDRHRYVETMRDALKSGGHVIMGTFAPEGPTRCSGLDVVRYGPESLAEEFGDEFELVRSARELHRTPLGIEQAFQYCSFRKR
jgi:SAM-dependent methyltransferase